MPVLGRTTSTVHIAHAVSELSSSGEKADGVPHGDIIFLRSQSFLSLQTAEKVKG